VSVPSRPLPESRVSRLELRASFVHVFFGFLVVELRFTASLPSSGKGAPFFFDQNSLSLHVRLFEFATTFGSSQAFPFSFHHLRPLGDSFWLSLFMGSRSHRSQRSLPRLPQEQCCVPPRPFMLPALRSLRPEVSFTPPFFSLLLDWPLRQLFLWRRLVSFWNVIKVWFPF